jgi:hypothetical protein
MHPPGVILEVLLEFLPHVFEIGEKAKVTAGKVGLKYAIAAVEGALLAKVKDLIPTAGVEASTGTRLDETPSKLNDFQDLAISRLLFLIEPVYQAYRCIRQPC